MPLVDTILNRSSLPEKLCSCLNAADITKFESVGANVNGILQESTAWSKAASTDFPGFEFGPMVATMPIPERQLLLDALRRAAVPKGAKVKIELPVEARALATAVKKAHKNAVEHLMLGQGSVAQVVVGTVRTKEFEAPVAEGSSHKRKRGGKKGKLATANLVGKRWASALNLRQSEREEVVGPAEEYSIDVHIADGRELCVSSVGHSGPRTHSQHARLCTEAAARLFKACAPAPNDPRFHVVFCVRRVCLTSDYFGQFQRHQSSQLPSLNLEFPSNRRPQRAGR